MITRPFAIVALTLGALAATREKKGRPVSWTAIVGFDFFPFLELPMDQFAKGMAAGLIATAVLSILMFFKAMMGVMPALDIPNMSAGMMGMSGNTLVGWLIHLMIGIVHYGAEIAVIDSRLPENSSVAHGMITGVIGCGWLVMMVTLMPMAGAGLLECRSARWLPQ